MLTCLPFDLPCPRWSDLVDATTTSTGAADERPEYKGNGSRACCVGAGKRRVAKRSRDEGGRKGGRERQEDSSQSSSGRSWCMTDDGGGGGREGREGLRDGSSEAQGIAEVGEERRGEESAGRNSKEFV